MIRSPRARPPERARPCGGRSGDDLDRAWGTRDRRPVDRASQGSPSGSWAAVTHKIRVTSSFNLAPSWGRPESLQTHQALVVEPVALAGRRFEARAVDDGDRATTISDQPRTMELSDGFGDPGAPHAEHRREEFVGHRHGVAVQPIARHQDPAGTTLLDAVQPGAGGGLRTEVEESCDEAEHEG